MDIRTPLRTRIKVSDGWAADVEGIYLGYNAQYDSVKVGLVDEDGNYTGDHTRVPRSTASVVEPAAPQVAPAGNVTITLPAEYAARALAQLRAVREDGAVRDATTDVHVLVRRLEDALVGRNAGATMALSTPTPAPADAHVANLPDVDFREVTETDRKLMTDVGPMDVTDPVETMGALVADTSGPKGQERPVRGTGAAAAGRSYTFDLIDTQTRKDAVRARAGELYRAGTHTPVKAWDAALNEDWFTHLGPVPDESEYGVCVPVMGGAGHTFTPDGDFPPVPTCRTMDRNSRGTGYREVDGGDVTCTTCLMYRDRRAARRAKG